jgi:CRP-like cAMP-binding protein
MPELDGYGVLHMLSKNIDTSSIPFIFLTAKTERSDMRKGMEMGADDYLTKPFDDLELLNAVESRLNKIKKLKQNYKNDEKGLHDFLNDVKGYEELNKLAINKKVLKYKKKDLIYSENSYPSGLYLVQSGKIKTFKTNADGKELITGLYKNGEYFGFTDLLEESAHHESAAVLENAELVLISKEDFYSLVYKNSIVAKKFIKMLANEIADKEKQLLQIAYNSVRKRVSNSLVKLYNRYNDNDNKDENFKMAISREDVANLAGTSTETAIRTLSDLKEEKIIEIKGSTITIIDMDKLSKMKN